VSSIKNNAIFNEIGEVPNMVHRSDS